MLGLLQPIPIKGGVLLPLTMHIIRAGHEMCCATHMDLRRQVQQKKEISPVEAALLQPVLKQASILPSKTKMAESLKLNQAFKNQPITSVLDAEFYLSRRLVVMMSQGWQLFQLSTNHGGERVAHARDINIEQSAISRTHRIAKPNRSAAQAVKDGRRPIIALWLTLRLIYLGDDAITGLLEEQHIFTCRFLEVGLGHTPVGTGRVVGVMHPRLLSLNLTTLGVEPNEFRCLGLQLIGDAARLDLPAAGAGLTCWSAGVRPWRLQFRFGRCCFCDVYARDCCAFTRYLCSPAQEILNSCSARYWFIIYSSPLVCREISIHLQPGHLKPVSTQQLSDEFSADPCSKLWAQPPSRPARHVAEVSHGPSCDGCSA
ncbi:hypothetical protein PR048_026884 [Dryococelus australis]|uniref:Uncharacterized protein n=1 Tax=Dryococelus australis TaxID=614101 RepID=A0ABQ9GML0_9NEOP|nr:hypothetical protein PR048_026884 [Dryococelus australis]